MVVGNMRFYIRAVSVFRFYIGNEFDHDAHYIALIIRLDIAMVTAVAIS